MEEVVFFKGLATKGLQPINSSERYFEGYLTVEIKDKQGEVTIVDELMKVLPIWIDRGAPISDTHSNRIIGKGINYAKVDYKDKDGEIYPAIKITGKIHKNYELDNDIWEKIKSGEYKGLSFGGATKSDREPIRMKDGSIAYSLKDLEHYEVAVCRDPAVPLALITDFNPLAKATTMGEDIGNGRMLIKCDKFGCYVTKNNKEGGQIEPALAHEETVRETETHNPKSMDHPIELETKGEADEATDKLIRANKDPKKRKELIDLDTKQRTAAQDAAVAQSDRSDKDTKKGEDIAKEKGYTESDGTKHYGSYCASCGERKPHTQKVGGHKLESGEVAQTFMMQDDKTSKSPDCPTCTAQKEEANKGEDWSNADGDRHSMYNQDTDGGGMGKHRQKGCKCGDPKCKDPKCEHKREVGTGYGAEQNADGEVQWTGSGSPYPKKKTVGMDRASCPGCGGDKFSDWGKTKEVCTTCGKTRGKHKKVDTLKSESIITNIHSRLKSLDFLIRGCHIEHEGSCVEAIAEEEAGKKKKRLKKDAPKDIAQPTQSGNVPKKDSWIAGMGEKDTAIVSRIREPRGQSHGAQSTAERKREHKKEPVPQPDMETALDDPRREGRDPKSHRRKKAVITNMYSRLKNIQTRIGISDFLLRDFHEDERRENEAKREQKRSQSIHGDFTGRPEKMTPTPEQIEHKKIRDEKEAKIATDKKERQSRGGRAAALNRRKKEGEFGGMNTGEVEWTEPRQTANDRKERDRKEKAEEGYGQSMLHGQQRGLGHDGGSKQGSGESTQVTEVKEEKDKSAYENHEQDGSNKKQIPHSNVDTTKTTNI